MYAKFGQNTPCSSRGNSNVYKQHMLLNIRKPILKYTLIKNHARIQEFSSGGGGGGGGSRSV